jgi:hypothetical protein
VTLSTCPHRFPQDLSTSVGNAVHRCPPLGITPWGWPVDNLGTSNPHGQRAAVSGAAHRLRCDDPPTRPVPRLPRSVGGPAWAGLLGRSCLGGWLGESGRICLGGSGRANLSGGSGRANLVRRICQAVRLRPSRLRPTPQDAIRLPRRQATRDLQVRVVGNPVTTACRRSRSDVRRGQADRGAAGLTRWSGRTVARPRLHRAEPAAPREAGRRRGGRATPSEAGRRTPTDGERRRRRPSGAEERRAAPTNAGRRRRTPGGADGRRRTPPPREARATDGAWVGLGPVSPAAECGLELLRPSAPGASSLITAFGQRRPRTHAGKFRFLLLKKFRLMLESSG